MEILGQLLTAHNVLQLLAGPRQAAEFAAHTLSILPGARATGALLDGCEAREGEWRAAWPVAMRGEAALIEPWRSHGRHEVLVIPVATVAHAHGRLVALVDDREAVDLYVPFLANYASAIALVLDGRQHRAKLEAASERLRRSEESYRQLFSRMTHGFALHEVITDDDGDPVDYRFLEVNPAFEAMTGLSAEAVIGRTALEVLPELEREWIARFGAVALGGKAIEFESHIEALGRQYSVMAYSPEPGRFAVIVSDVTDRRRAEQVLRDAEMSVAAQEERARLARDLHDSVTQALFAVSLKAESLAADSSDCPPAVHDVAEEVRRLSRGALAQMRTMLLELRSEPLDQVPIRQLLGNAVEATRGRTSTSLSLSIEGEAQMPAELHAAVYRITQEALNNVARHAAARHASVQLELSPARVRLAVTDDGRGFVLEPGQPTHLGLRSMQERAGEAGAALTLDSAPGKGTRVVLDWTGSPPAPDRE